MDDKKPIACWYMFNCPEKARNKCPAYIRDRGDKCWLVAANNTEVINSGVGKSGKTKNCWDCEFFKKMHPEISGERE